MSVAKPEMNQIQELWEVYKTQTLVSFRHVSMMHEVISTHCCYFSAIHVTHSEDVSQH